MYGSIPAAAATSSTQWIETSLAGTIPASVLLAGAGVVDDDDGIFLIFLGCRPQQFQWSRGTRQTCVPTTVPIAKYYYEYVNAANAHVFTRCHPRRIAHYWKRSLYGELVSGEQLIRTETSRGISYLTTFEVLVSHIAYSLSLFCFVQALASGFLMTDMLQLRMMLVGGYAGLVTFHSLHARPMQIPLRWSALFVVVNAGAAMLLFVDQWIGALLSDDEMALYETHFRDAGLTPGQFYHLLKLARTVEIEDGNMLTKEGCVSPNLYFIERGQAKVYHHGNFASYVDEGGFVNDVAFQQSEAEEGNNDHDRITSSSSSESSSSSDEIGEAIGAIHSKNNENNANTTNQQGVGAYGTVVANGDCKVLVWDQTELKNFLGKRPEMDRNMKHTLSQHLVRSLLKQREVRRAASIEEHDVLEKTELIMPERRDFRRIKTSSWP